MKAINVNGQIKTFGTLPNVWKNVLNLPKAETSLLESLGFFDVVMPLYDRDIQTLGAIYFDDVNRVFTYPVEDLVLADIDTLKSQKKDELKSLVKDLYQTAQWYVEMKRMNDEPIPQLVKDKLNLVRTKYLQVKGEIEALTTQVDVIKYQLPYTQIQTFKDDLNLLE